MQRFFLAMPEQRRNESQAAHEYMFNGKAPKNEVFECDAQVKQKQKKTICARNTTDHATRVKPKKTQAKKF